MNLHPHPRLAQRKPRSEKGFWLRPLDMAAVALLLVMLLGVFWQPYPIHGIDLANRLASPSAAHWFGTDHLGRDLFSRVSAGAVPSLIAVAVALSATLVLGALAGAIVALAPPAIAAAMRRLAEIVIAMPQLVVALIVAAIIGATPVTAALALAATAWASYALVTAALIERLIAEQYWRAAEALGVSRLAGFRRHLLPHLRAPLGALAGADAARAVVLVASLGFLGLAADTGRPEWGAMIHEYRVFVFEAPRLLFFPMAAVALLAFVLNLLIDSDRDLTGRE
jgi:ABC-type dipeptide/oligopeptide/nickel transport system permease subunit